MLQLSFHVDCKITNYRIYKSVTCKQVIIKYI